MKMIATTIRFSPVQYAALKRVADLRETPLAQFVRDSSFAMALGLLTLQAEREGSLPQPTETYLRALAMYEGLCEETGERSWMADSTTAG